MIYSPLGADLGLTGRHSALPCENPKPGSDRRTHFGAHPTRRDIRNTASGGWTGWSQAGVGAYGGILDHSDDTLATMIDTNRPR
jgi:hypothetical protein